MLSRDQVIIDLQFGSITSMQVRAMCTKNTKCDVSDTLFAVSSGTFKQDTISAEKKQAVVHLAYIRA